MKQTKHEEKNTAQPDPITLSPTSHTDTNTAPVAENPNLRTHHTYIRGYDVTGEITTDLPGPFPITSANGHKYILVLYDYDRNAILIEPMRNHTAGEHLWAYNILHQ
jgi:hypothetical protein